MHITEELLFKLTGLKGKELVLFYIEYKKQSTSTLYNHDIDAIKADIINFKNQYKPQIRQFDFQELLKSWESKSLN